MKGGARDGDEECMQPAGTVPAHPRTLGPGSRFA